MTPTEVVQAIIMARAARLIKKLHEAGTLTEAERYQLRGLSQAERRFRDGRSS